MAVPDLSESELRSLAGKVIIGIVKSVTREEVAVDNGTNRVYTAEVETIREEGGYGMPLPPKMMVTYWQADTRPEGWTGTMGQRSPLPVDKKIRIFIRRDSTDDEVWDVLMPNGWNAVE